MFDSFFAARMRDITPFLAMEVMERGLQLKRQGIDVIQLGVGEPDFDAPPCVVDAAVNSLRKGDTHYTDSRGLHALREAIAEDCFKRRGVRPDVDQVIVTMGTSPAIAMCMQLLVDPGDEIIIATPHYPCYPNMITLCGGQPVLIPTDAVDGYVLDVKRVKKAITKRTKAILIASPANPTGAVQPESVMRELCELGLPMLSDEIYDGLIFDDARVYSPLRDYAHTFVLDGFSKRYAMTGFRLGYVIAPKWAARKLQIMQQNLYISAAHFSQQAGIEALQNAEHDVARMRTIYDQRRKLTLAGIRELGFVVPRDPMGAFYILADARHLGHDSLELAFKILERAHVALGPGRDFGEIAEGHLRFSYTASEDAIREGLQRLRQVLPTIAQ